MRSAIITLIALLVIALSPLAAYPSWSSRASLTTTEEETLGDEFAQHLRKRFTFIQDPGIADYVDKTGQQIVRQHHSPPFEFRFYVVKEDVYNAFAGPGGHIYIYSGLLAAMENEEELAGILAHEIAHVLCRHISKRIEKSTLISLATLAGILAGALLGGGSPEVAQAVITGSVAAGQSLVLKYSRDDERQADQVGLKYLTKTGYGGEGLLRMLQKIRRKHWFGSNQIPSYITTHPAIEERMAYLDTWIQAHPEWRRATGPKDSVAFHKMRTKLIAQYSDTMAAQNFFDAQLRKDPDDFLGYYGRGLLLGREGRKKEAVESLKRAVELRPLDEDILRDLGKTYFRIGDYAKALKTLTQVVASDPTDPEGYFFLGRSQIETGEFKRALETFNGLMKTNPGYLPGMYYLGETYGKLGHLAEAHYHRGMYYKEKGSLTTARFHLKRALKLFAKDPERQQAIKEALKGLDGQEQLHHSGKSAS